MKYEIEFFGIDEDTRDADAICFRYFDEKIQRFVVCVYDGGTIDYGNALVEHLKKFYFSGEANPRIDYVICSHSDQDHSSGLSILFDHFRIGKLIMNRPWLYVDELFDRVSDGRITKNSLADRFREAYPFVYKLEEKAKQNQVAIETGFQGKKIGNALTILSPSKAFYLDLIVESEKPKIAKSFSESLTLGRLIESIKGRFESWRTELLRENVSTTSENETSIIILGEMGSDQFILTGDSGIRALNQAIDFASDRSFNVKDTLLYQVPHHGGRHNVSPSLLNRLLGPIVADGERTKRMAIVSVGKNSDHPRKMVVNAFLRRGVPVYAARGKTLLYQKGTPPRDGYYPERELDFCREVEEWQ